MENVLEPILCEVIVISYDGDLDDDNNYDGKGIALLNNECNYDGDFQAGYMHGSGKFTWKDGVTYEGTFVLGQITGTGIYSWPDGSIYDGEILNGLRHGKGTFTSSGGQIYTGNWLNGKRHGHGEMSYDTPKTISYTGEWINDLRDGYGLMTYNSGNIYEGYWKEDKKCGDGCMKWTDRDEVYVGSWKDDLAHGYGEHIWGAAPAAHLVNSLSRLICNMYRGEWKLGLRDGFGTFFYANGSRYSGYWKDGKKDGKGIVENELGQILCRKFKQDRADDPKAIRATEEVRSQAFLYINDLANQYPSLFGAIEKQETTINSLKNLLLRYNSHLKKLYERYCSRSAGRRTKEVDSTPPSFLTRQVDKVFFTRRNLQSRVLCMGAQEMREFATDVGLVGIGLTGVDVMEAITEMRFEHERIARDLFTTTNFETDENTDVNGDIDVQSLPILPPWLDTLGLKIDTDSDFMGVVNYPKDHRHPIRFHEFMELIVRLVCSKELAVSLLSASTTTTTTTDNVSTTTLNADEAALRAGLKPPPASVPVANTEYVSSGAYRSLLRFLSEDLLPIVDGAANTEAMVTEASFITNPVVSDCLRIADSSLKAIWEECISNEGVNVLNVVKTIRSSSNPLLIDALNGEGGSNIGADSILRLMGVLPSLPPPPIVEENINEEIVNGAETTEGDETEGATEGETPAPVEGEEGESTDIGDGTADEGEGKSKETVESEPEKVPEPVVDPTVLLRKIDYTDYTQRMIKLIDSDAWCFGRKESVRTEANTDTPVEGEGETPTETPDGESTVEDSSILVEIEREPEDRFERLVDRVKRWTITA